MLSNKTAFFYTVVLGGVIFLCRFLPFALFKDNTGKYGENNEKSGENVIKSGNRIKAFLSFVEATVPAVAMTVLAVNAIASEVKVAAMTKPVLPGILPVGIASLVTALLHLWKRNALISIFGGTVLYMLLKILI